MNKTIKVMWVCHFSNAYFRNIAPARMPFAEKLLRLIIKNRDLYENSDFAQWNINAITEFEKFDNIELHVACPIKFLIKETIEIQENSVCYHFFRDESTSIICRLHERICRHRQFQYKKNRKKLANVLYKIEPDIVHIIGPENPYYSLFALDVPFNIPVVTQLQTLVNDPVFVGNFPISPDKYKLVCKVEQDILLRSDYIGCNIERYQELIKQTIKPGAKFLNTMLAIGPIMDFKNYEKQCDLVYFSASIEKAFDLVVEAFIIAKKTIPLLTLSVIGGCSPGYKQKMEKRLEDEHIMNDVVFYGRFPEYKDVLDHVRYSKCAVLPLKVDIIASTIREAMALGIPVVSTVTSGTPLLNKDRESVLLSEVGDHNAMADNIVKLLTDESLYNSIRRNAYITIEERYSNTSYMKDWLDSYYRIVRKSC